MWLLNRIQDWLWVVQAFWKGKVLDQQAFKPQPRRGGIYVLKAVPGASARRMNALAKLYGHRVLTVEEAGAVLQHQ